MTDIPAYNEKEISMKDISFVIRAIDGRKTSGGRLFCADRSGTETRSRTVGEWLRYTPITKKRYP